MKEKLTSWALVLIVAIVFALPMSAIASDTSNTALGLTQFDVAVQVYQAASVNHEAVSSLQALQTLQDRGVIPGSWNGSATVSMAEVAKIMNQMGIEVAVENPSEVVNQQKLEQVLKAYQGEIDQIGEGWEAVDQFSQSITLGEASRRVISGSDF